MALSSRDATMSDDDLTADYQQAGGRETRDVSISDGLQCGRKF